MLLSDSLLHPLTHSLTLFVFVCICFYDAHVLSLECVCACVCVVMHCNVVCLCGLSRVQDSADGAHREVNLLSLHKATQ